MHGLSIISKQLKNDLESAPPPTFPFISDHPKIQ